MPSNSAAIRTCESFAATNYGVIPRDVAIASGLDRSAISRLVRSGRWRLELPRAYMVAGIPIQWRTRLAVVKASLQDRFAFSHRSAGALLGLDGVPEGHVEITTDRRARLPGVVVHRLRSERPRLLHVDGFPVTIAPRTVMDLFSVIKSSDAEVALEDALRKRLTSLDRQWSEYENACRRGRDGCGKLKLAPLNRDHRDGTMASRMEARLRSILKVVPGREAVPQFPVRTSQNNYRLDFAYPDVKLGIEAQSLKWHLGNARWVYDLARDRHLKRVGWTTIYYTWDDLLDRDGVASEISDIRDRLANRLF